MKLTIFCGLPRKFHNSCGSECFPQTCVRMFDACHQSFLDIFVRARIRILSTIQVSLHITGLLDTGICKI